MPIPILEKLIVFQSRDEFNYYLNRKVREKIATLPRLPLLIIETLSEDNNEYVRGKIALHHKLPLPIVKKLTRDKFSYVRQKIAFEYCRKSCRLFY